MGGSGFVGILRVDLSYHLLWLDSRQVFQIYEYIMFCGG